MRKPATVMVFFFGAFIKLPQIAPIWMPHKHRKSYNQNPRKKKAKRKKNPHSIIDGNASCQTRGSEDPKRKQNQVHNRIVEPGNKNLQKKGIVSWDNNNNNNNPQKKEKKTSKQANKQR
jgi:hypothetical protein